MWWLELSRGLELPWLNRISVAYDKFRCLSKHLSTCRFFLLHFYSFSFTKHFVHLIQSQFREHWAQSRNPSWMAQWSTKGTIPTHFLSHTRMRAHTQVSIVSSQTGTFLGSGTNRRARWKIAQGEHAKLCTDRNSNSKEKNWGSWRSETATLPTL